LKFIFIKILIFFALTCLFSGIIARKVVLAASLHNEQSSEAFNLRVTRENFADFHDTLIIENENKQLGLEKIYFDNFDFLAGKFNLDELFSVRNPKFEPNIYTKKEEEKVFVDEVQNHSGIYNINISGNSGVNNNIASNAPKKAELNLFSEVTGNEFNEKLKKAANLIKTQKNSYEAQKILAELEKTAGNNAVSIANIAKLYIQSDKSVKAYELLKQAETLAPNDFKIIYTSAVCLYKQNALISAEEKLKKVAELKPDFMYAHYNLGNVYHKQKNYHKALDSFKKALELAPENADIYYNIAVTLEMLDNKKLAKQFYSKCLELNPKDKNAIQALDKL